MNILSRSKSTFITIIFVMSGFLSSSLHATTTLTFTDNASPSNPFPATGSVGAFPFSPITVGPQAGQNPEFRVVADGNTVSGGGEKSVINVAAGVVWQFSDDVNLTGVLNSEMTPGTNGSETHAGTACIPAGPIFSPTEPSGGIGLFLNAPFLGSAFGFVAPIVGSNAAILYGNATITVDLNNSTMQVVVPVAEAQWANLYFPLGMSDDGVNGNQIVFNGTLTNIVPDGFGNADFDFVLIAQHIITACEDGGGFAGQTTQWELAGTGFAPIVVASAPITVSGAPVTATLAGTVSNDGRISVSELSGIYGATNDIGTVLSNFTTDSKGNIVDGTVTQVCAGSCFAFTVSGAAATETIELSLTSPIPSNGYYRKFINGAWMNFDESAGDLVQSAPGLQGDCTTGAPLTYTSGLTPGHFCVRLTIVDDGPNDADKSIGTIVDPGGIAVIAPKQVSIALPAQSLDDAAGCSVTASPIQLAERADWLIVAAFIGLLGIAGFRRRSIK